MSWQQSPDLQTISGEPRLPELSARDVFVGVHSALCLDLPIEAFGNDRISMLLILLLLILLDGHCPGELSSLPEQASYFDQNN